MQLHTSKNVYSGATGLRDFLNPTLGVYTPLVELPPELNPYRADKVRVYAKLMSTLPLANVKSVPAWQMLARAKSSGRLRGVRKLVENSSGNTVFSLAVLGRLFGIARTKAFVSHEVSLGKLQLLRFFGTEVEVGVEPICPDPSDATSGIYKAQREGQMRGVFNPGQYDNQANPEAHQRVTGPQIWEQTKGKICLFGAGLGTTGTMVGVSKFLKKKSSRVQAIGVVRAPNNPVPGVRTQSLLSQIAFRWQRAIDSLETVPTSAAYARSLELCRAGLLVGPSSGFALQGVFEFIKRAKENKTLHTYKNEQGEIVVVFLCCDTPFPYIEEYFEHLDAKHFPEVANAHLLARAHISQPVSHAPVQEWTALQAYELLYEESPKRVRARPDWDDVIRLRRDVVIVDVRSSHEYADHHLPASTHIELSRILQTPKKYTRQYKDKTVLVVCAHGVRSKAAAQLLQQGGARAYSLAGGLSAWSAAGLPRWRPDVCRR